MTGCSRSWLAALHRGIPDVTLPFQATLQVRRDRYQRKQRFHVHRGQGGVFPRLSPDRWQVAFIALNVLWSMPVGGRPR
jgi:hypothetical protein